MDHPSRNSYYGSSRRFQKLAVEILKLGLLCALISYIPLVLDLLHFNEQWQSALIRGGFGNSLVSPMAATEYSHGFWSWGNKSHIKSCSEKSLERLGPLAS